MATLTSLLRIFPLGAFLHVMRPIEGFSASARSAISSWICRSMLSMRSRTSLSGFFESAMKNNLDG